MKQFNEGVNLTNKVHNEKGGTYLGSRGCHLSHVYSNPNIGSLSFMTLYNEFLVLFNGRAARSEEFSSIFTVHNHNFQLDSFDEHDARESVCGFAEKFSAKGNHRFFGGGGNGTYYGKANK